MLMMKDGADDGDRLEEREEGAGRGWLRLWRGSREEDEEGG